MGYLNIENLYKDKTILLFKEVWATEKIHGTSAWITYKDNKLVFHSGGGSHEVFVKLFDEPKLFSVLKEKFGTKKVKIHGEFYGGKINRMSHVYGINSDFIVFDIRVEDLWLSFDKVQRICSELGLDVVDGVIIPTTIEAINEITNKPSVLAFKKGMGEHIREGVVLKPLQEFIANNGERVIAKNKTEMYQETMTPRKIENDPEKLKLLKEANEIAEEWVTLMRLEHVLDKFPNANEKNTGDVIKAMILDIEKECNNEAIISNSAKKSIGKKTRDIFFHYLKNR